MKLATTALVAMLAAPVYAAPLTLTPADPQPAAGDLKPGLAVSYAYPRDVRNLQDADAALAKSTPGPALAGLSYVDTNDGDQALTSTSHQKVAAAISGYLKFDAAGSFEIEVFSNDGIRVVLGGQQVALYDDVHGCDSAGLQEVVVPLAGWYSFTATYFQRKGSACLMMDWNVEGQIGPVPDSAFGYVD
ncbi:MAG: hypothetical protein ACJAVM_000373 [Sulfitobacter sp.]|jgi:hypothetical protein